MDDVGHVIHTSWPLFGALSLLIVYIFTAGPLSTKLRRFKGPRSTMFSEIPHIRAFLTEQCQDWYAELNRTYGPIARVSPRILATSSPDLWARVNAKPGYTRSKWFYRPARFDWRNDTVFTEIDNKKHETRRKRMIPGYSGRENLTLESDIDTCISELIQLIQSGYACRRKPMDLALKIQYFTLDVISLIGFGKCFGLIDADDDPDEYVKSTAAGLRAINKQMAFGTWWTNWIPLIGPKMDLDPKTAKGFEKMLALSSAMVEVREQAFKEQKDLGVVEKADMLTSFMKHGLSGSDLKAEVILQIVAGSDTTAAELRGAMLYILANPRVYKVLQSEIDEAVRSGKAPAAPEIISYAQAKQLAYLQAVIRETIRIFPPLNDPLSRDTPPEGDTVDIEGEEVFLPGGVSIIPSFTAMHRNENVYGADTDLFRPERWLEESNKEKLEAMKRTNDLMFGHGQYLCLGKGIAMMEMSKALFELLRNFDWGVINPQKPWTCVNFMGLRSISDQWVQVEEHVIS
ncbi:cytochrome P450 [Xylariaceae sp. FL0662B]|nr:cytochrome P450 [Xylariaceae sp. FL0662B]